MANPRITIESLIQRLFFARWFWEQELQLEYQLETGSELSFELCSGVLRALVDQGFLEHDAGQGYRVRAEAKQSPSYYDEPTCPSETNLAFAS